MKSEIPDTYRLVTELGEVCVALPHEAILEAMPYVVTGEVEACRYVRRLLRVSYGERGRLLGDACTSGELFAIMSQEPLMSLVAEASTSVG